MRKHVKVKLTEARDKIADPICWCQNSGAENDQGRKVATRDRTAVKWCAIGAVESVILEDSKVLQYCTMMLNFVSQEMFGHDYIIRVNDTLGHAAVLEVFDKAIAKMDS